MGVKKVDYPGATWSSDDNKTYLDGYVWQELPVYNDRVDPQKYGKSHGLPRRLLIGVNWANSSLCGSRSVHCRIFSTDLSNDCATRGCNYNYIILGLNGKKMIIILMDMIGKKVQYIEHQ